MHLLIAAVGHLKEPFYRQGQEEYARRLKRYVRLSVVEVAEEPIPRGEQNRLAVRIREGERLLKRLPPDCYRVALAPQGKTCTSLELASWLENRMQEGRDTLAFLVGGPLGLSPAVMEGADLILSLSPLTFPHQLARLVLLEQLYRACRIIRQQPYHY